MTTEKGFLNVREAAAYLGFSVSHLHKLLSFGKIKSLRVVPGGSHKFTEEMLRSCLKASLPKHERKMQRQGESQ